MDLLFPPNKLKYSLITLLPPPSHVPSGKHGRMLLFTQRMLLFPLYFMLMNCNLPWSPPLKCCGSQRWQACGSCVWNKFTGSCGSALIWVAGSAHHLRLPKFKHFTGWIVFGSRVFGFCGAGLCHMPIETLPGWCHILSLAQWLMQDHKLSITPRNAFSRTSSSLSVLGKG